MNFNLIPFKGLGEFQFGTSIENYSKYNFDYEGPEDDGTEWSTYSLDHYGIDLFVEEGLIISISCSKKCLLRKSNLINMNIYDFSEKFKLPLEDREKDNLYVLRFDEYQDVYEFEELGIQIWSNSGIIKTVISSGKVED